MVNVIINVVSILLGRGDGSFIDAVNYSVDNQAESVALGDLNGDGALDLAVATIFADSELMGPGDCSFNDAVNLILKNLIE